MPKPKYRVLILGLDGATFDLMLPWVNEGRLPVLERLLRDGARSNLKSTVPPITPCAWTSLMTGKNPGKHGLFDFVEPIPGSRGFRFTNASSRAGETLWGYLSRQGRRVGVVNVPMTYPPEHVNGYMISGLDTPHEHSKFMFPETLKQELRDADIDYRIDLQHLGNMRTDARRDHELAELKKRESIRTNTLKLLTERYPADFRMLVYSATDQVQHHFWHYMDSTHDKYDAAGAPRYQHAIRGVYEHIDQQIGSVLEGEDENTVVIIMSDHGFGPTSNVRLRLNQVLEQQGLLQFVHEHRSSSLVRKLAGTLDRLLRFTLSNDAKRTIAGMFPKLRVWFERLDEAQVDWDRTHAYVNEAYRSSPSVWLNRQGAFADIDRGQLRDKLVKVEKVLEGLVDPKTGQPAISNVYRSGDLYHGPYSDRAPDLLPSWWEDGFLLDQSVPGGPEALMVERSKSPIMGGVEFAGSHRLNGVFMIAGGPARKGLVFDGAEIIDVAPTVLYLMGLPVPEDMDGRVLTECLDPNFVSQNAPRRQTALEPVEVGAGHQDFTDEESALIAKRLQALGYIA